MAAGNYKEAAIGFGEIMDHRDARVQSRAAWDRVAVREIVSAGNWHTVGLEADGTVVAVGLNKSGQCDVSALTSLKVPDAADMS